MAAGNLWAKVVVGDYQWATDEFYVYERMPYYGQSAEITGRGLQGLTDGLMKVVWI